MLQVGGADNGVLVFLMGFQNSSRDQKTNGNLSAEIAVIKCFIKFEYSSDEIVSMMSLWRINQSNS